MRRRRRPEPDGGAPGPARGRRLPRHLRHVRTVAKDPQALGPLLRDGLVELWRTRGGGFYGLGYVVTFLLMEARLVVAEFSASESVMSFLTDQLLEFLLRVGLLSFVNVILAFLWPVFVLERLGGWGLVVLALGYLAFQHTLRPRVEARFPRLRRDGGEPAAAVARDEPGP